jgi:tetratricopeptide (TPR) repeat protein
MERAYAVIGGDEPDADLGFLVLRLASAHWFAGHPEQSAEWVERGLDLAEALRVPELLARGWNTKAIVISVRRPEEARGLFQLAAEHALAHDVHHTATSAIGNLSDLGFQRDRYAESLGHLERMLGLTRRIGHRANELFALSEITYPLTMLGRWDEALARLAEIPDEYIGVDSSLVSPLMAVLEIHLRRGELDQARGLLARYEELSRVGDVQTRGGYHNGEASVLLAEGNHAAALVAAEQAMETRAALGLAAQSAKLGILHALEAAFALGDRAKVEELLAIVDEQPPGLRPPLLDAAAHWFRARLAREDPGADRQFTEAAGMLRGLELPFHLAVVQLEHGEWLIDRGRNGDAETLLAEAEETFARLGATPWLERVHRQTAAETLTAEA